MINPEELREYFSLSTYWENDWDTNCYAFALGLDVPEDEIVKDAYKLGKIGAVVKKIPLEELRRMTLDERLRLDLEVLGVDCKECSLDDETYIKRTNNYVYYNWIIALLTNGEGFHFIRKTYDGIWYQKWGYFASPINFDFDHKIIEDPERANFRDYKLVRAYKLRQKKKNRPLFE